MSKMSLFQIIFLTFVFKSNEIYGVTLSKEGDSLNDEPFQILKELAKAYYETYISFDRKKGDEMLCQEPPIEFLYSVLTDHQMHHIQYGQAVLSRDDEDLNFFQEKLISNVSQTSENNPNDFDKTGCDIRNRNFSSLSQRSMCPWKYEVTSQKNRFPHLRVNVKCTCDSCQVNHVCVPVTQLVPVLVRDGCDDDGYFKWIPSLDKLNVACVCAY